MELILTKILFRSLVDECVKYKSRVNIPLIQSQRASEDWIVSNLFSDIMGLKKRQFNSTLIGANEINMQVNESNIVNQFKCEIKFS